MRAVAYIFTCLSSTRDFADRWHRQDSSAKLSGAPALRIISYRPAERQAGELNVRIVPDYTGLQASSQMDVDDRRTAANMQLQY